MDNKQQRFWQGFRVKKKYLLSGLLAFSLTLFVWAAPAQQSPSPTSSLSPKEKVVAEIKSAAERHVETDTSMQISVVLKLYETNTVGLTAPEIAKIYEEEYLRLKKAKEADPWEQIIPKVGWVGFFLLILWTIFQESLKKWSETLVKNLWDKVYNRFAGINFLRGVALRRYQKALIEKHRELKIPFRSKALQMQEVYVPLKVVDGGHEKVEIDAYRTIAQSRRLMVKGAPGAGKSMLLKHIALSYAERGFASSWNPVPILLELHRLTDRDKSINQYLVEALGRDEFPKAERFVEQGLKNGTFLLLLDGLDEVNSAERSHVVRQIKDLIDECSKCRVLITCRTQVYRDEFREVVDHTLEVVEFTDQQIQSFLRPWQASMPPDKSPEQLLQNLHDRPKIMTLARNPLMLTIIAYLYTDTPFVLPHSRSEFYQKSTDVLLDQWHQEHNQFPARDKKSVLRHLALYNQDSGDHNLHDRRSVDYLTVIAEVKRVLPSLNIDEDKAESFLKEIVERSGLLLEIDGGDRYQFAHLTLQEYFAAAKLIEDEPGLIARFEKDPDGWREVVKLWCGLANDSTNIIERIFAIDKNTAFECLADAQKVDQVIADRIIDDFKVNLAAGGQEELIAAAFGAVAADIRPRGKAVFKFLAETLATDTEQSRRLVAANALSMTNLPEAAKILAEQYKVNHAEVAQPLVRMGDLAVDQLRYLAESSYLQAPDEFHLRALDELYRIGTPKSANFLVRFLWHKEPKIANRVARHLASLLVLPAVEDSLHETDHAPTPSRILNISTHATWIWEPFTEVANSKLPLIVSQIAYLLEDSSAADFLQPVPNFDPRIIIPLCSIMMIDKIKLPKEIHSGTGFALEMTNVGDRLKESIAKLTDDTLGAEESRSHWRFLLSGIHPQLQLELLSRLINSRRPQKSDWQQIFKPVKYNFSTSWHYRVILFCSGIASLIALFQMFYPVVIGSENWIDWFVTVMYPVVVYFWLALGQGINELWGPNLFVSLGLFGSITFFVKLFQLFRGFIAWTSVQIPFQIFDFNDNVAVIVALAGAIAVAGSGTLAFDVTEGVVDAGGVIGVGFGAMTASLAGFGAVIMTVLGANSISIGVFVFLAVAMVIFSGILYPIAPIFGAGVGYIVWIGAGIGIGIWSSKKINNKIIKLFAFLAFPFFCWSPLVAYFSTTFLLRFLPWQNVALIWFLLITTCTALWVRGQRLDSQARNPLQGLIPNPKESQGISLKKTSKY